MKRSDDVRQPVSKRVRDAAAKVLRDPSRSKKAMTAAGLALTQRRKILKLAYFGKGILGAETPRKDYSLAGEALRR